MFTGEGFDAVCNASDVFVPVIFSVTAPGAAVTASTPAPSVGVPSLAVAPMPARLSAAETRPVTTPAPMRVESTPMATEVFWSVTGLPSVAGFGDAVPVIGTANCEKVPVTPRHPLFWVVLADAGPDNAPTPSAAVPTAISTAPTRVRKVLPVLLRAT